MTTKKAPGKKPTSTKKKLKGRGLVRVYADITQTHKDTLWTANEVNRYTSTTEFKPFFESVVNALARHKDCTEIIARIMSGK